MPDLIGLTGKKRAGKDSVAGVLRGIGYGVDSFAAPIRHVVAEMLGWGPVELDAHKEEPIDWLGGVTPRLIMQKLGTEFGREMIDPDLWLKCLLRRIERRTQPVVIFDVRFDNEARAVRDAGGIVIEIRRAGLTSADSHVSEAGVSVALIDDVIQNDGTLEELAAQVLSKHAKWTARPSDSDLAPGTPPTVYAGD